MFHINISDLLSGYTGESKELAFDGEILPGFYEDIVFKSPLKFQIKIIALDDGIEVIFESLDTTIEHEGEIRTVHLSDIARTFKNDFDPLAPDDIKHIENGSTIDLKDIIREEILISFC